MNINKNNINNTYLESVQTNNDSWGRVYNLSHENSKGVEKNSNTSPNVLNFSSFSKGSIFGNTSKPDGSS